MSYPVVGSHNSSEAALRDLRLFVAQRTSESVLCQYLSIRRVPGDVLYSLATEECWAPQRSCLEVLSLKLLRPVADVRARLCGGLVAHGSGFAASQHLRWKR